MAIDLKLHRGNDLFFFISQKWRFFHGTPITLFGLFAEIERDLISERTCEGLAAARAKGRVLGRPKGSRGPSKLDGREGEIQMLLGKKVSKASIAKILDVSRSALLYFISSRKLLS